MARFFVNRPIVAMVISIIIVLLGIIAMQGLPISQYPDITPPVVEIKTSYRGASALNVEQSVATPLEQEINGIENMLYLQSTNANDGSLTTKVSFESGTNLDIANVLTQNRVSIAEARLPEEVKRQGLTIKKSLTFPLMMVTLTSPNGSYSKDFLGNYARINIVDELSRIKGVGQTSLMGSSDYSMRIWVKPDLLARLGMSILDINQALKEQNAIMPGGQLGANPTPKGTEFTYTVKLKERLQTEEEFENIIIRTHADGSQVRLKDVARLELGAETYSVDSKLNHKPASVIAVYQTPGSNALSVANEIKKTMERIKQKFPDDIRYDVTLDTTLAVSAGIDEIIHTLFEAIILVLIVVFIFLQSFRATLIPMLTVPVSLIGTFMVFPLLGFSINVFSLLGLVLAIGIVVDDAIVVVEAVMHNIEHGLSPKEATLKAMREVSGPVVAIALILTAVFVPVAFMPGITGKLYQQFAVTIAISVLFSAFNALTLSPALSALLLKPQKKDQKGLLAKFFKGFNRIFDAMTSKYTGMTGFAVKKMARSLTLVGLIIVLILVLGRRIPGGFLPEEDQGYFLATLQLPSASSLERTNLVAEKVGKIISAEQNIKTLTTVGGFNFISGAVQTNAASFFISMKNWDERPGKANMVSSVIARLNRRLALEIPEGVSFCFGPPAIPGLGTGSGYTIMLQDKSGGDPQYLAANTNKFIAAATKRPEIGSAFSTYSAGTPQISLTVDENKATKMNVSINELNATIGSYLGGGYVNDFNRFGRVYRVFIQAEGQYRDNTDDLNFLFVRSKDGKMIPVSALVTVGKTRGPEFTTRFNLYRSAEVSGQPAPGYSSAEALAALEEVAKETLPAEMGYAWSNMSYQEKAAEGSAATVFMFAILLVFLILAAQYESWTLPFSVLLGTPFAVFGAFLGLWLAGIWGSGYINNVFAQIGLVMLIGLSAKNAILIVEFARANYHAGKNLYESAMEAAKLRLRPILMTAFAFILGVIPLLTATGAGAEGRKVMGMSVFAGMLIATIIGVFLIPVLFVFVEKMVAGKFRTDPSLIIHTIPLEESEEPTQNH